MKFGILGDAKIAREKLIPAITKAGHEIVAIGRRNPDKPSDHPLYQGMAQLSYDDMLAMADIDAIYNPLPNHLHASWSRKAMQAGKHVLCEKPMILSEAELDELEQTSHKTGQIIYEAIMVRHHPQWHWLRNLDLGDVHHVHAHFSYPPQPDGNIRNYADMGGGPVWDIGCYTLLAGMMAFGTRPELQNAHLEMEDHLDVEKTGTATIDFGQGRILQMSASSAMGLSQFVHVIGSKGWARLDVPFNAPPQATARSMIGGIGEGTLVTFDECDQYELMVRDFAAHCQTGTSPYLDDSRDLVRILGAIVKLRNA